MWSCGLLCRYRRRKKKKNLFIVFLNVGRSSRTRLKFSGGGLGVVLFVGGVPPLGGSRDSLLILFFLSTKMFL